LGALAIAWLFSGIVFSIVVHGPGTISAWLIWGSFFFLVGWMFVGLPIVALGDRILRMNRLLLMAVAGAGGAAVMLLAVALTKMAATGEIYRFSWSLGDFLWPGVAFLIAGPTGLAYQKFLHRESVR
jgi:hypothetical protein